MSVSLDGQFAVSASGKSHDVALWDLLAGQMLGLLRGPQIAKCASHRTPQLTAVASADQTSIFPVQVPHVALGPSSTAASGCMALRTSDAFTIGERPEWLSHVPKLTPRSYSKIWVHSAREQRARTYQKSGQIFDFPTTDQRIIHVRALAVLVSDQVIRAFA